MSETEEMAVKTLTAAQKSRMERNHAKALALKQTKLVSHPYAVAATTSTKPAKTSKKGLLPEATISSEQGNVIKMHGKKYIDKGGGFFLEEELLQDKAAPSNPTSAEEPKEVVLNEAIPVPLDYDECLDCGDVFVDSYLRSNFDYSVCDKCRDTEEKHTLITRSEAKAEYLLKDCDLDRREPILRFISRKNPHNVRWGEMKLYLHLQIEKRALEIWGTEEELARQHEQRGEKREVSKIKKYNKSMKQLRMEMRSSLFKKKTYENHVHEFGPDTYNEETDEYTHTCLKCPYTETYEKL